MSRSFLYVDDWKRAVANVLDAPDSTYNIGSPLEHTIEELWETIAEMTRW